MRHKVNSGRAVCAETIDGSPADMHVARPAIGLTNAFARTGITLKKSGGVNV